MKKIMTFLITLIFITNGCSQQSKKASFSFYGQSCFVITTSQNTIIMTDPGRIEGYIVPMDIEPDVVTVSHEHFDHNNVEAVKGNPVILRGLKGPIDKGLEQEFNPIDEQIKDVRIYDVVSNHRKPEISPILNAIFIFEFDGIRVAHLGDIGYRLSEEQLNKIGKIDILIIPVGGKYTVAQNEADSLISQINPGMIVFPMHFKTALADFLPYTGEDFFNGKENVEFTKTYKYELDLNSLPKKLKYVLLEYYKENE